MNDLELEHDEQGVPKTYTNTDFLKVEHLTENNEIRVVLMLPKYHLNDD